MGYTHYWSFVDKRGERAKLDRKYKQALKLCSKLAYEYNRELKAIGLECERLSGYSAHVKPGTYGGLKLNGKGEGMHEEFSMREHFAEALKTREFCKTARKPYDIVVVASLCILKHYLGENFVVDSDGDRDDWQEGLELARRILLLTKLEVPSSIRDGRTKHEKL